MKAQKLIKHLVIPALALALGVTFMASTVVAVPYASGISNNGNTVYFVLNQAADSVVVLRNGANPAYPGTTAGVLSFDMTGFSTYSIIVSNNVPKAWTQYVPDQTSTSFEYPFGVSINKNPWSANFGRVYVSSSRVGTTAFGRACSDGIYILNADGSDAGFTDGGRTWTGNSAPYKSLVGPDDHLYVADLSNDMAYEFNDNMTATTALIAAGNKSTGQFVAGISVEGTQAAGNRKIYLVDNNTSSARKGLIGYTLGANAAATANDIGTQIIGPTCFTTFPRDGVRDSHGDWYMNHYSAASGTRLISKFDGTLTPPINTVLWDGLAPDTSATFAWCVDVSEVNGLVAAGDGGFGIVYFFNLATGAFVESLAAGGAMREVAFDAAGNLVTVDNADGYEWARFWSPGGDTLATTSFDGVQRSFRLGPPAQVSVTASQATVSEAGPSVTFTISRVGSTESALTVNYVMSGTAVNGTDYSPLSGSAVIPATASSVPVTLSLLEDTIPELSETVILSPTANPNYSVVLPISATVSILDNESPEISFGSAAPKKLLESYAPLNVTHQVVRKGLLTSALTVNLAYSGTATRGADFGAPTSVTVAAGAATANLVLTPINDQAYEGDEIATASIAAGTGYSIGTPSSISATIVDDEVPPGTVLFSDAFETDSSALWKVNLADPSNGFVEFAWNYSAVGIPAAPGGGGTKGMRMRCGNVIVNQDGLSVSPLGKNFTGAYRLKFDMWINYNGPMPDGGPGSTQNFDAGVGTSGDPVVWLYGAGADGVWFSATGDGADGDTGGDYNALIGDVIQNDDTGFYAAGTGAANSGIRNASHSFYSLWGGQAAPAAQLALYPNQTGVANIGNAGMAWHSVVITKAGDVVTWAMDGITIATVTNTTLPFSTNVFVGYQDLFAAGTPSDVPEMSFGLVDNLRVETLTPFITGFQLINGGTQVQIDFIAGIGDSASAFALQTTANLATPPGNISATISSTGPGQFRAVRAVGGSTQFYRIRRN